MARCVLVCIIKSVLCSSGITGAAPCYDSAHPPAAGSHGLRGEGDTMRSDWSWLWQLWYLTPVPWHRILFWLHEYMAATPFSHQPSHQKHISQFMIYYSHSGDINILLVTTTHNDGGGGVRSSHIKCCIFIISLLCGWSHSSSGHQCFCPCCLLLHRVLVIPASQHPALLLCHCVVPLCPCAMIHCWASEAYCK